MDTGASAVNRSSTCGAAGCAKDALARASVPLGGAHVLRRAGGAPQAVLHGVGDHSTDTVKTFAAAVLLLSKLIAAATGLVFLPCRSQRLPIPARWWGVSTCSMPRRHAEWALAC